MDSEENTPLLRKIAPRSEFNAVAAASVTVAAVAFEALGLLPSELPSDVPASLRCSSFVLIALCAGPVVGSHRTHEIAGDRIHVGELSPELEQRMVTVGLLALTAILGERHAEGSIRAADAIFSLLAGWSGLAFFALRSTRVVPGSALFASSLFYTGVRIVMQAVSQSSEVMSFRVSRDDVSSRGYALSDCVGSTALAFGGSCCVCCGLSVLANDRHIESFGSRVLSPAVSQIAAMAFAAALVAQLSMYSSLDALPAIFSDSSCAGDHCDAARRARRFFVSNSHVGCLWACVVAMVVFGLPRTNQQQDKQESLASVYYNSSRLPSGASILTSFVSASVIAAVVHFADQARLARACKKTLSDARALATGGLLRGHRGDSSVHQHPCRVVRELVAGLCPLRPGKRHVHRLETGERVRVRLALFHALESGRLDADRGALAGHDCSFVVRIQHLGLLEAGAAEVQSHRSCDCRSYDRACLRATRTDASHALAFCGFRRQ